MGKIKNYHRNLYASVTDALYAMREPYMTTVGATQICSEEALEECLTFLCLNDIPHGYSKSGAKNQAGLISIVTLSWDDEDGEHSLTWYESKALNTEPYYLLIYGDNFSDEFDVEGFTLMSTEDFVRWSDTLYELRDWMDKGHQYDFYFGTNEWIEYDNFAEFSRCFRRIKITQEHRELLEKLAGSNKVFGLMPTVKDIEYWISDQKLEEEDGED